AAQAKALKDPATPPGCLFALTESETGGAGDAPAEAALAAFERTRAAFRERLEEGAEETPPGADRDALAILLTTVLRGAATLHRLTGDCAAGEAAARAAVEAATRRR
ncbi:MAG: hypothetical protein AAF322_12135, partial [Pseudomonadota bacterium]